jgi:hypothetical protein
VKPIAMVAKAKWAVASLVFCATVLPAQACSVVLSTLVATALRPALEKESPRGLRYRVKDARWQT